MKKYFALALIGASAFALACGDSESSSDDDLGDANQPTGGLSVDDCPAVPDGAMAEKCITSETDVGEFRALEAGLCGYDMSAAGFPGCAQLDQAGELSDACEDVSFGPDFTLQGCCSVAGVCGAMDEFMGFGCTRSPNPADHVPCGG